MEISEPGTTRNPRRVRWGARLATACLALGLAVAGLAVLQAVRTPSDVHAADGSVAEGDDPGRLTHEMSARVNAALAGAAAAGVPLEVTSGWRSADYQQHLLDQAIERYGSRAAATHWVLPPADSAHVRGLAVDVGPEAGMAWLEAHGAAYGLCRRYDNEPWHFEPLTDPGGTCPPREPYAVATH